MPWEAWVTLLVLVGLLALLVRGLAADLVCMAALALLLGLGLIVPGSRFPAPEQLLRGFGNEGLITVAALFVVAAGLTRTGALHGASERLLGRPASLRVALARLTLPAAGLSAFLNNTPIVAMLIPVVEQWGRRSGLPTSRLHLPLSYAAILGGTCTLIGTSTNLVVHGLLLQTGHPGLGLFEVGWVGVPCALLGLGYMLLFAPRLLPDHRRDHALGADPREFTVELVVDPQGALCGRGVEQAGLRRLPGLFLVEIERDGRLLPAVGPEERLLAGDRLLFAGAVESVAELRRQVPGLLAATGLRSGAWTEQVERHLFRVVVADACPLVGRTIREGRFRTAYEAAVIAVARRGERLRGKLGDVVLQPGDALLLEAQPSWAERQRAAPDFWVVDAVKGGPPPRRRHAWRAWAVFGLMLAAALAGLPLVATSLLAAVAMIGARCLTTHDARRSLEWPVLVVIGATLGIGRAIEASGLAAALAGLVDRFAHDPRLALLAVYATTMVLTEVITNNAAAALMFPVAHQLAQRLGLDPTPFAVAIMFAASASFATPIGYQTNLMVSGPGGYRFADYLRFGVPLNLLMLVSTTTLIPLVWPLR